MLITNMKEVKVIKEDLLKEAITDWKQIDLQIKDLQKKKADIENYVIANYSDIDISSDATGTERISDTNKGLAFKITHKISTKVDKDMALKLLETTGEKPEHFFNVKWDYSETIAKGLNEDELKALAPCLIKKRAKSTFAIEEI